MIHDPTTTYLLKLPLGLKKQVDNTAAASNKPVALLIREAICRYLDLPQERAVMQPMPKRPLRRNLRDLHSRMARAKFPVEEL